MSLLSHSWISLVRAAIVFSSPEIWRQQNTQSQLLRTMTKQLDHCFRAASPFKKTGIRNFKIWVPAEDYKLLLSSIIATYCQANASLRICHSALAQVC